jgi:hypothetical protein
MNAILVGHRDIGVDQRLASPWIRIFDCIEGLKKLYDHEASFCEGVLFCSSVSFSLYRTDETNNSRPKQILGPPLKGKYCQPLILAPSHLSGTNLAASGPQRSVRLCIAQTE